MKDIYQVAEHLRRERIDKLEIIEKIRAESASGFSEDFFKIIDSQDFYFMALNRVRRVDPKNLKNVLNSIL